MNDQTVVSETPVQPIREAKDVAKLGWMDVEELSRYVTETGKIQSRENTGLSAKNQRHVARLIKRARNMLLMK
ncbi:MAG: 30S ribosomal protein S18 [Puniceicoccales bacterium]|jgi:small subunit ribosomal protein S18|nr:30S ribosomal protein S18 [Puniceicoccales bacterium]